MRNASKQESVTINRKKINKKCPLEGTDVSLVDRDFKPAIMNMFKRPKETVLQVLKKGMMKWLAKERLSIKRQKL